MSNMTETSNTTDTTTTLTERNERKNELPRNAAEVTTTATRRRKPLIVVRSMWSHTEGRFALIVMAVWLAVSLISLIWTPYSLLATDGYHVWAKPSAAHILGTDGTGADVLSWLMAGSRTNLLIVILTIACAAAFGLLLVAAMVSRHSALAGASVVAVDALISIPTVLLALILAVPLGASIMVIVVACGFGYGLNLARVARPQALLAARSAYVEAALWSGASSLRVFVGHVLPNIMPVMLVQLSLSAGTAVLAESGLTYLGIGVPSGVPSWGHSLATSVKFINVYPLTVLWPGLIVTVVVIALNLLGDALGDAADPLANTQLRVVSKRAGTNPAGDKGSAA
ncbi:dipeptide/oligopeptide/nickel ABC transporter permease [Bifidobacterium goeldii]|uniref:Dipeptide/oligopeptide/nickel ABC transporter permease n=2 Tax=Bifidobacterium goeldii TaxID=2306975 RepID=A0A430FFL1_9BIFI|nr:dipeptide/oligopeptide/nickel ABC transporter permease [Bifidobacterium goeldii]